MEYVLIVLLQMSALSTAPLWSRSSFCLKAQTLRYSALLPPRWATSL